MPRSTQDPTRLVRLSSTGLSPAMAGLSMPFDWRSKSTLWSYNPERPRKASRFGLFRVRSPLLTESLLFSLPPGTEMVHFPGFAPTTYVFSRR